MWQYDQQSWSTPRRRDGLDLDRCQAILKFSEDLFRKNIFSEINKKKNTFFQGRLKMLSINMIGGVIVQPPSQRVTVIICYYWYVNKKTSISVLDV